MMSQNRQGDIDRMAAQHDYDINIKAELEIEALHQKVDALREKEVLELTTTVRELTEMLKQAQRRRRNRPPRTPRTGPAGAGDSGNWQLN